MWKGWDNPSAAMRMKPFWFINAEVDRDEAGRQIDEMADKGLGGVFVCARQGLKMPYLSRAWFDFVEFCTLRARERGLEVWLYDEFPYPSGMAGGLLPLLLPGAPAKELRRVTRRVRGGKVRLTLPMGDLLCAAAIPVREGRLVHGESLDLSPCAGVVQDFEIFQRTGLTAYNDKRYFSYAPQWAIEWDAPDGETQIEAYVAVEVKDFKYYGGFFDPGAPGAAQAFIAATHEKTKAALGQFFGNGIAGMFTDETHYLGNPPYSAGIRARCVADFGYDPLPLLPRMFDSGCPDAPLLRYRWFESAHRLLKESWHRPLGEWCERNGLIYTVEVPSLRSTNLAHAGMPGGDSCHEKIGWDYPAIEKRNHTYRANPRVPAAAARHYNREHAMIEAFHSVGWSMTLEDARAMIDRMTALGIDTVIQHAFFYSTEGLRKHDAPPSQFFQTPYWPHYKRLTDYAGRLSSMLRAGEPDIAAALVDPVSSVFALMGNPLLRYACAGDNPGEKSRLTRILDAWRAAGTELQRRHIGYEPIDPALLAGAEIDGASARVGRAVYKAVAVPDADNLEPELVAFLIRFMRAGGHVAALHKELRDDFSDPNLAVYQRLLDERKARVTGADELAGRIGACVEQNWRVRCWPETDVLSRFTLLEDGGVLFLSNQSAVPTQASLSFFGPLAGLPLSLLDAENGRASRCGGEVDLPAYGAAMVRVGLSSPEKERREAVVVGPDGWRGRTPLDNVLRLGRCSLSYDTPYGGIAVIPETEPATLDAQIAASIGVAAPALTMDDGFGLPPRPRVAFPLALTYCCAFRVDVMPGRCRMTAEDGALQGEDIAFFVNGLPAAPGDVLPLLRVGLNELTVTLTARRGDDGLRDPVYLEGDFGVEARMGALPVMTAVPSLTDPSAAVHAGFPYYSGEVSFVREAGFAGAREIRMPWLDEAYHDSAELFVDGVSAGVRPWPPYTWTAAAREKSELTLVTRCPLCLRYEGRVFDAASGGVVPVERE